MHGRPCILRYAETDCPPFDVNSADEGRQWMSSDLTPVVAYLARESVRALSHLQVGWQLAIILEDIFRHYKALRRASKPDSPLAHEYWWVSVLDIHRRLEQWQAELPAVLRPLKEGPILQHTLLQ